MKKLIVGHIEEVEIDGLKVSAKIDTGSDRSSICASLLKELKLKPTGKKVKIKSSLGEYTRELYKGKIKIKDKEFITDFTIADRNNLRYKILVGRDILKRGFYIDPSK